MIDPEQIPDEVLKVLAKELPGYEHNTITICYALAAALSAWETPMHRAIVGKALDEVGNMYPAIIPPCR